MAESRAKERLTMLSSQLIPAVCSANGKPVLMHASCPVGQNQHTQQFKYSVPGPRLSFEQRKFYEENGYILIKKLVSLDDIESFRVRFQEICMGKHVQPYMTIMKDVSMLKEKQKHAEDIINKLQDYVSDPVLSMYYKLPQILDYVESFCGSDISAMHTMLINKPPDSGSKTSRHPLHQDLNYFPFRPADKIVCSWTAMQKVSRANGCLVVIPGTHKGELQNHQLPKWEGGVNKMYYGIENYDPNLDLVYLEMDPGDTVFFHPILIHGSGRNQTSGYRKAISCHFASNNCIYPGEGIAPSELTKETAKIIAKRMPGMKVSYADIWKFKSVVVRGKEGTVNG